MDHFPDTPSESIIELSSKAEDGDALDPRVQIELERLNHANEAINQLELQRDEARKTFDNFRQKAEDELIQLEKSIGDAVPKSRCYYEARIKLRDAKEILIKAKHRFERAQELHVAAKELAIVSADFIDEAERSHQNAAAWNETYHQALAKAQDAETEKYQADFDQQVAQRIFSETEKLVEKLQKDLRRSINKSKPYYEMRVEHHQELDFQKRKVYGLERCVSEAKRQYQESLRNLEHISNEIHEQRSQKKSNKDLGQQISNKELPSTPLPLPMSNPTAPIRRNYSDDVLRSCLLRTETLPPGIFTNATDEGFPTLHEPINRPEDDINDQFILYSKEAPRATIVTKSDYEKNTLVNSAPEKLPNLASRVSQTTDDDDDRSGSLHALSDEQLNHFNPIYYSYSSEILPPTGTHDPSFQQTMDIASESVIF